MRVNWIQLCQYVFTSQRVCTQIDTYAGARSGSDTTSPAVSTCTACHGAGFEPVAILGNPILNLRGDFGNCVVAEWSSRNKQTACSTWHAASHALSRAEYKDLECLCTWLRSSESLSLDLEFGEADEKLSAWIGLPDVQSLFNLRLELSSSSICRSKSSFLRPNLIFFRIPSWPPRSELELASSLRSPDNT